MRNKDLIPVLHVKSEQQAIENLDLLLSFDIKKVFLIGHGGRYIQSQYDALAPQKKHCARHRQWHHAGECWRLRRRHASGCHRHIS